MQSIRSLEKVSIKILFDAFQEAFKDYEMQLTENELGKMLLRRGFSPELSFGAFSENKLLAFTFNGIGTFNGLPTAYDTGTGTIPAFRGKGLANMIFKYSIPHLKNAGISRYLLEVLQHNTKAVSLYQGLGFKVSREFNYFSQSASQISFPSFVLHPEVSIKSISLDNKEHKRSFWDHPPSWQNNFEAIERAPGDFQFQGAYIHEKLVGYCIFEPGSGDISQIAVAKNQRRKGIGKLLLHHALKTNLSSTVKAINYETNQAGIQALMASFGITLKGQQYEMILDLKMLP